MTISGGTLSTNGSGVIRSVVPSNAPDNFVPLLDGASNGALANLGTIEIGADDKLVITGTINNTGVIRLLGDATLGATLLIDQNTTLQGKGSLVLSNSPLNSIISAGGSATLENAQTISGAGLIDVTGEFSPSLAFHNDSNGTVNATGANALTFGIPTFFPSGQITNDGLMEASGTGGLAFKAVEVTNNGTIRANNGSPVDLGAAVIISGGTLSTNGTGVIRSVVGDNFSDNFTPILDGISNGALANSGSIEIGATDKLVITGTINNSGTIKLLGNATQGATLFIDQNTTLQGTGSVVLSNSGSNVIEADSSGSTLDNFQSIAGAGFIDVDTDLNQSLLFQNDGIISATGTNALVFEANLGPSPGHLTNNGLMEAFGAGGLVFANAAVANSNGIIQANNGSQVDLGNRSVISGGMLATVGTGVIRSIGNDTPSSAGPMARRHDRQGHDRDRRQHQPHDIRNHQQHRYDQASRQRNSDGHAVYRSKYNAEGHRLARSLGFGVERDRVYQRGQFDFRQLADDLRSWLHRCGAGRKPVARGADLPQRCHRHRQRHGHQWPRVCHSRFFSWAGHQ